jgi:putative tryptophan/tyrosine transport system substrate-binding protein
MNRREFVALLGAASAWSCSAHAQEVGRVYRLGFLLPIGRDAPGVVAMFDELRQQGFVEGRNLAVIEGGFGVRPDEIAARAAAMVKAAPDAIVSGADLHTRGLLSVTRTVPLIGMTEDMVAAGLAASFARPGGNVTGISLLSPELDDKRQGILIEAAPGIRRMAALYDLTITPKTHLDLLWAAAKTRGVELSLLSVSTAAEIRPQISEAKAAGAEALNFLATPLFFVNSRAVIDGATEARLPAIYQWPDMGEDGGLLAYGPRFSQVYRQRARMVAKILRGANPAELPIELPSSFVLVVNLRTAKLMDFDIPASLLYRAERVVE